MQSLLLVVIVKRIAGSGLIKVWNDGTQSFKGQYMFQRVMPIYPPNIQNIYVCAFSETVILHCAIAKVK